MSPSRSIDVRGLPEIAFQHNSPIFWAVLSVVFIEGTMFVLVVASYFYARLGVDVWPPPGTQFPHILVPTAELLLLILSCLPAYWASEAVKKNDIPKFRRQLIFNVVLAAAAVALRVYAWGTLNFTWKTDIHGSIVWAALVLHTFDLGADLLVSLALIVIAYTPRFCDPQRRAADWDGLTWYFLVAIWIPLYFMIYLAPHMVQAS